MRVLGYATVAGRRTETTLSGERDALLAFLEAHLFDDELVLTDTSDQLIFHAVDGVDLHSRLDEFGIDLPALYRRLRERAVSVVSRGGGDREPWEVLYDSIGLSPGEVTMRQRAKRAAKAARTVEDVVELLADTYFDASFESEGGSRSWGSFDPDDLSVVERVEDGAGERVRLQSDARVRHQGSSEDIHVFVLLDVPSTSAVNPTEGP